ncbi:MAG: flagellar hook capping FlgD N-terminal domain-containing protein [Sedimentisphaerales bacterium]
MSTTSSTSSIASSSSLQSQFLNLLVTQLKNQDPTDPMDSNAMTAELAQFSQLEQLENLSSQFSQVLSTTQESYANSLVGKTVTYNVTASDGTTSYASGTVNAVDMQDSSAVQLIVGDSSTNTNTTIALSDVLAVQ